MRRRVTAASTICASVRVRPAEAAADATSTASSSSHRMGGGGGGALILNQRQKGRDRAVRHRGRVGECAAEGRVTCRALACCAAYATHLAIGDESASVRVRESGSETMRVRVGGEQWDEQSRAEQRLSRQIHNSCMPTVTRAQQHNTHPAADAGLHSYTLKKALSSHDIDCVSRAWLA